MECHSGWTATSRRAKDRAQAHSERAARAGARTALRALAEMRAASEALAGAGAMPFAALAQRVFGEEGPEAEAGLAGLISIGIRARLRPEEFSLLPGAVSLLYQRH